MTHLTQEKLKSILRYCPDTGLFVRLVRTNKYAIGSVAGSVSWKGYIKIKIDKKEYFAHRLAWLYMTGFWPEDQMDHISNVKDDNRWTNLRECSNSQNCANRGIPKTNSSGFKGVCWNRFAKRWVARIGFQNKKLHLGHFDCPQEAALAYNKKAVELFGEFARVNE